MRARLLTLASLLLLALPCDAVKYRVVDLGVGKAWSINGDGVVVGSNPTIPYAYSEVRGFLYLGPRFYGRQDGTPYSVNRWGDCVGVVTWYINGRERPLQPFLWTPKSGFAIIPLIPREGGGYAYGLNDEGVVVGQMLGGLGEEAFLWSASTGTVDLGRFDPRYGSGATGVNNSNEVCGSAGNAQAFAHAFRWTAATGLVDLGTLPGYYESFGEAINDEGEIVGTCYNASSSAAFRIKRGGVMVNAMPNYPGVIYPACLNNAGWFCGTGFGPQGQFAAVCPPDGSVIDVAANAEGGTAGLTLIQANGINDRGGVCGIGLSPGNDYHSFLAVKVE